MHQDPTASELPTSTAQPLLPDEAERLRLRVTALSRWDNEGGAGLGTLPAGAVVGIAPVDELEVEPCDHDLPVHVLVGRARHSE